MKRAWMGAGLLAVLLLAGLLLGTVLENRMDPGVEALYLAGEAALDGDWEKAEEMADSVRRDWESGRCLAAGIMSHEDLELIETAFAQLRSYAGTDGAGYSALCTALAHQLDSLARSHRWSWENFF